MQVTDNTKIKSITPKYTTLVNEQSVEGMLELFDTIQKETKALAQQRTEFMKREQELDKLKKIWYTAEPLFNIEYVTKEIEYNRALDNIQINIVNDADARNKH